MNSYNDLVTKILEKPVLKTAVEGMVHSRAILNLVSLDWEEKVLNSNVYKKHIENVVSYSKNKSSVKNFEVQLMTSMDYHYHVLVAGCWKFHTLKNGGIEMDSIVCNSCQPLLLIGKSMAEHNKQMFVDNSRFFFQSCDANICSACEHVKKLSSQTNIWCVKNTKVFNGERIRYLLRSDLLKAFGHSRMYGILRLKISSRTTYGDNRYKIGGLCAEMILFNESALDPPFNIEHICIPIEATPHENPKITFPEEMEVMKRDE